MFGWKFKDRLDRPAIKESAKVHDKQHHTTSMLCSVEGRNEEVIDKPIRLMSKSRPSRSRTMPVHWQLFHIVLFLACQPLALLRGAAATPPVQTSPTTTTLVGSLIRPFEACRPTADGEIAMQPLLQACQQLQKVMHATGQDGNARDLGQNIRKIEQALRQLPASIPTTMRALLQHEKATGVLQADGHLRNPSAAVGLLWVRRSVAFQHGMNRLLLEQPELSPLQAALQTYHSELQDYHSWGLQKIYKLAFRTTTPDRPHMLAQLRGNAAKTGGSSSASLLLDAREEAETTEDLQRLVDAWQPVRTI